MFLCLFSFLICFFIYIRNYIGMSHLFFFFFFFCTNGHHDSAAGKHTHTLAIGQRVKTKGETVREREREWSIHSIMNEFHFHLWPRQCPKFIQWPFCMSEIFVNFAKLINPTSLNYLFISYCSTVCLFLLFSIAIF